MIGYEEQEQIRKGKEIKSFQCRKQEKNHTNRTIKCQNTVSGRKITRTEQDNFRI